jgi:hypothetical protein
MAAARGTSTHEMVEALLKNRLEGITLADYYLGRTVDVDGFSFDITQDDIDMAEIYVDYINKRTEELNGKLLVEEKVNAPDINDNLWGTADAVILGEGNRMVVGDLKSGAWAVDVVMNEQLMCYALGCLSRWGNEDTVIEMTIVQPMGEEPSFNAGNWCKFCSHKEVCETYKSMEDN